MKKFFAIIPALAIALGAFSASASMEMHHPIVKTPELKVNNFNWADTSNEVFSVGNTGENTILGSFGILKISTGKANASAKSQNQANVSSIEAVAPTNNNTSIENYSGANTVNKITAIADSGNNIIRDNFSKDPEITTGDATSLSDSLTIVNTSAIKITK